MKIDKKTSVAVLTRALKLRKNKDISMVDVLCAAVGSENTVILEYLISKGVNVNAENSKAVRWSAATLNPNVIIPLLKENKEPEVYSDLLILIAGCFTVKNNDNTRKILEYVYGVAPSSFQCFSRLSSYSYSNVHYLFYVQVYDVCKGAVTLKVSEKIFKKHYNKSAPSALLLPENELFALPLVLPDYLRRNNMTPLDYMTTCPDSHKAYVVGIL